ncbi:hypothetical protein [Herbidospora sp. NBRC 101105]|uniref:hypothetical protein n=1 Tax=Herbidospora sp. NBRC 101105 TaxID=3032195 RepID=UPI0024A0BC33|nr:hypothetical protein [Herbidospora sp. NBRC 101105]GLX94910.1 hypothetical protein Hesp01_28600 [Herbidospora sp. NBRC 101105]
MIGTILMAGLLVLSAPAGGSAGRDGGTLDGFAITHVPAAAGPSVSDFESEWEDVTFATRVWERETPDGHQADLRVAVLRGDALTDLPSLREFLTEYDERETWDLKEFSKDGTPGLATETEAFWLDSPGVALTVRITENPLTGDDLMDVVQGISG